MKNLLPLILALFLLACEKENPTPSAASTPPPPTNDSFLIRIDVTPFDSTYPSCPTAIDNTVGIYVMDSVTGNTKYQYFDNDGALYATYQFWANEDCTMVAMINRQTPNQCAGTAAKNQYRMYKDSVLILSDTVFKYDTNPYHF